MIANEKTLYKRPNVASYICKSKRKKNILKGICR